MKPVLFFVRHGQTDWNAEHRLQGQSDIDLNAIGRIQAGANGRRLGELLGDPNAYDYVSSPMRRARETMEIARSQIGLPCDGYRLEPRLVEVHFGDWQGFTYRELEQRFPNFADTRERDKWNIVPPGKGAESYAMLTERVRPWFKALDRPTVCVAHGGVARVIFRLAAGLTGDEAAHLDIPQDRVLRVEANNLEWL
jgi:broad specificity phosphatase PhoE